jgi:hypothetical protein
VKLQGVERAAAMFYGREVAVDGARERDELVGDEFHLVAVTHPDFGFARDAGEEVVGFFGRSDFQLGAAELADGMALDAAAEGLAHQLHSVADAEDRDAEIEDCGVTLRGAVGIHARRAAGKNEAFRGEFSDPVDRDVVPHDFGVHVLFADAAGDELGELRTEIQHEHAFGGEVRLVRRTGWIRHAEMLLERCRRSDELRL